jgi:hypothetical protein
MGKSECRPFCVLLSERQGVVIREDNVVASIYSRCRVQSLWPSRWGFSLDIRSCVMKEASAGS